MLIDDENYEMDEPLGLAMIGRGDGEGIGIPLCAHPNGDGWGAGCENYDMADGLIDTSEEPVWLMLSFIFLKDMDDFIIWMTTEELSERR